ncbi:MAG: D-Ala-D-Ala carboxypeptidase family metallohydrolase [Clostridia bacterium]
MVIAAYISKVGRDHWISPHFTLAEMACKDGSDKVLYSTELMDKLEKLRAYGGFTVHINSGYRTPSYNKKIGGASKSQHTLGTAADIIVKKDGQPVDARLICCLCQDLGFKGIARISWQAVHVDMRSSGSYRGDEYYGYGNNVNGDFYRYFGMKKSMVEALKDKKQEEEEVTQQQFNDMMNVWISQQAAKEPDEWSKEDREWAEANGIIKGTGAGYSYRSCCTREQMVAFLHRLYEMVVGTVDSNEGQAMIKAMISALENLKK